MEAKRWARWFGFWLGVALISFLNVLFFQAGHNVYAWDIYIFIVSLVVLIVIWILKKRK